ncbi:MAG: hypothetical protein ACKOCN_07755 [Planctomycetaceae bacterium]
MAIRRFKVYSGPEMAGEAGPIGLFQETAKADTVKVTLGDILPLLADAVASNRTWLSDFEQDEVTLSSDLYDVLQAYRHFRRPGA